MSFQTMPPEIEKMFIKPEVSNQIARNLSSSLTPVIERHVKEVVAKTLIPTFQAETSAMCQGLSREIHAEVTNLKKDIISWQTDALRSQEVRIFNVIYASTYVSFDLKVHDTRHGPEHSLVNGANQIHDNEHAPGRSPAFTTHT